MQAPRRRRQNAREPGTKPKPPRSRDWLYLVWGVVLVAGCLALVLRNVGAGSLPSIPPAAATSGPGRPALAAPTLATTPAVELPHLSAEPIVVALKLDGALNTGDVEAGLALFTSNAEVKIPPDLYQGSSQIRSWLSYLAANHFVIEPGLRRVAGDTVTWPAQARSDQLVRLGLDLVTGEATMAVRGDQIRAYTFVLDRDSASRLRAAQLAASEVLQDPLVVGLNSANVYGPNDVFQTSDGQLVSFAEVLGADIGAGPFFDVGGQPVTIRTGL